MRVLAFGTYDAELHPRVAVLLTGLRAHGHDVTECNEPLRLSTADRVATLRQPWRLPRLLLELGRTWLSLTRHAKQLPRPDVVVVGFLGQFDVILARVIFRKVPIVLDLLVSAEETALDRGSTNWGVLRALRSLDLLAIRSADTVVVDTEEHRALTGPRRRSDTVVVAVGATPEWFDAQRVGPRAPGPLRVVFYGHFTPLQGAPTIGRAAQLLAADDLEITMIGTGQDYDATVAAAGTTPRVRWIPWVTPAQLPAVVADHDVCLGIFGTTEKSQVVVPNKVYQGMAAGLAVITSDTPAQRRLLHDAAVLVPPGDAGALADELRRLSRDPELLAAARARAAEWARATMSPRYVTQDLADELVRGDKAVNR